MSNINKANRQVCDVLFMDCKTKKPFLFFETANTTTTGITGDSVFARAKGVNTISFPNAMEGTITIEAQVYPFKFFSLFSDGIVDTTAAYGETQTVTAVAGGSVSLTIPAGGEITDGTVFVYPANAFGEGNSIAGTYNNGTFTATTSADIAQGTDYTIGYVIKRTSKVSKISFNDKRLPKDFYITMSTLDKDEEGILTPFKQVIYKATPKRNFEISLSSDGDPVSVQLQMDILRDRNGDFIDFIEITDDEAMSVSKSATSVAKGGASENISISGAVGAVTATIKDSEDTTYTKLHAVISGDNDTVIISADSDAASGTYTVTLTDSTSGTAQTATITVIVPTT